MGKWLARTGLLGVYTGILAFWVTTALAEDGLEGIPDELSQAIEEHDRSGDGLIQPDEWPLDAESFAEADRDGSGDLTPREVVRIHHLREARENGRKSGEWRRKFQEADRDGDGIIGRAEFPAPDALFERFDRDGDGEVSLSEAIELGIEEEISKAFAEYDADLSGTLTLDEVPEDAHGLMLAADVDGDGEVTGEEAYDFWHEVAFAGDGPVASAEGEEGVAPTRPRTGDAPSGAAAAGKLGVLAPFVTRFAELDPDGDGEIGPEEWPASRDLLARMDIDRDGAVSAEEVAVRRRAAERLGRRAKELEARVKALGLGGEEGVFGMEAKALFQAGRYEEVGRMLDEAELWLARREASR